jgi:lipoic acid synthetase/lipoate-protein ligase A
MENMLHAITPSHTKLSKHGVESVRQRICLLKDYTSLPLEEIKQRIRQHLCGSQTITLTADDLRVVRDIEKEYLNPAFIGLPPSDPSPLA